MPVTMVWAVSAATWQLARSGPAPGMAWMAPVMAIRGAWYSAGSARVCCCGQAGPPERGTRPPGACGRCPGLPDWASCANGPAVSGQLRQRPSCLNSPAVGLAADSENAGAQIV